MPRFITKYGRPLPYFMKYASEYYAKQKLSHAPSNMNKLCKEIERWHRSAKWDKKDSSFDYSIMISNEHPVSEEQQDAVDKIYSRFNSMSSAARKICGRSSKKHELADGCEVNKYIILDESGRYDMSWRAMYDDLRAECLSVCGDIQTAANAAVFSCYVTHKRGNKKFMWRIASDGIVKNIDQQNIVLPARSSHGEYDYLGKKYNMEEVHY